MRISHMNVISGVHMDESLPTEMCCWKVGAFVIYVLIANIWYLQISQM